jgi:hypothetical protein
MKKWLFIALCVAVVAAVGILVACTSDGAAYYVRFTADGQSYELTKGFTDIADGDAVAFIVTADEYLVITGTTDNVTSADIGSEDVEIQNAVFVVLLGTTTGTYDEEGEILEVFIIINNVQYTINALSITVSTINEVGSTIEGTFTATIAPEGGGDEVVITDGEFKLYRAADDSILPPAE